jgi:hypothetical protein
VTSTPLRVMREFIPEEHGSTGLALAEKDHQDGCSIERALISTSIYSDGSNRISGARHEWYDRFGRLPGFEQAGQKLSKRSKMTRGLDEHRRRRSQSARALQDDPIVVQEGGPKLPDVIDPLNLPPRVVLGRPKGIKTLCNEAMPLCPHCDTAGQVIRAGFARGLQRYRCWTCGHTFGSRGFVVKKRQEIDLTCYRCGVRGCASLGPSPHLGQTGYCDKCKKRFIQGGRGDLAKYHLVLEKRVIDVVPNTGELQMELLQLSYRDVLEGKGYC